MQRQEDPIVKSSRREALVAIGLWIMCLIYSVSYCYLFGYSDSAISNQQSTELVFYLGFPSWVFWGLISPWVLCCLLSVWFAFGYMQDADLGEEADEGVDL